MVIITANNNCNDILFFKLWRNIVIRNKILYQLHLINKLDKIKIPDLNSLIEIKNKDYVKNLEINFNHVELPNETLLKFNSIINLKFGNRFNQTVSNINLVGSNGGSGNGGYIESLEFGNIFNKSIIGFDQIFGNSIKRCTLGYMFNSEFTGFSHLTTLKFNGPFSHSLVIPNSLISLELGNGGSPKFQFGDGCKLAYLHYGNSKVFEIKPNSLPNSLKILYLPKSYNVKLIENTLPLGLEELHLGYVYKKELVPYKSIPSTVTLLDIGKGYNIKFEIGTLPSGLKTLILNHRYVEPLEQGVLPNSLSSLTISSFYKFVQNQPQREFINNRYSIPHSLLKNIVFIQNYSKYHTYLDREGNKIRKHIYNN